MNTQRSVSIRRLRIAIVLFFVSFSFVSYLVGRNFITEGARPDNIEVESTPTKRPLTQRPRKFSAFPHDVKAHQVECSSCHKFPSENWNKVRTGASAFPDVTEYPRHESCLNCHKQQFFRGASPAICTICHVNPSPRNSSRHPFPNPREIFDVSQKGKTAVSDFAISFPHDKHVDIVTAPDGGKENCSACHVTRQPRLKATQPKNTRRNLQRPGATSFG
jgi:hypothetical protein